MSIRSGERAPYAPPSAVLGVIKGFRDRGLATPFTAEVLLRAGVSESLVPRTLNALEDLELIDPDGKPTPQMEALRRATSEEYPSRLAEIIKSVYSEVFQFVDPATADTTRVNDAFRAYEPVGQRPRMVSLFMGLCQEAGIVAASPRKPVPTNGKPRQTAVPRSTRKADAFNGPSVSARARIRNDSGGITPGAITGLLGSLPAEGESWTTERKRAFLKLFESNLDFFYLIRPETPTVPEE